MNRTVGALFALLLSTSCFGESVQVKVTSNQGNPVFQAVVYLEPEEPSDFPPPEDVAIMDQVQSQFVPHILAVQKGTNVSFPNSDSIKHHVYSFSPAKVFELQLYKGVKATPLPFQKSGEIELGCNVHDWMLGYVFVVDTPYFKKTEQSGLAEINAPPGKYKVKIWHPRIQDDENNLVKNLVISGDTQVEFTLKEDLLSGLDAYESDQDEFSDYE